MNDRSRFIKIRISRALRDACLIAVLVTACITPASAAREDKPYPHGKFRADCAMCHGRASWTPVELSRQFNHKSFGFSLEGAHSRATCRSCHASLDFKQASSDCATCHQDVHDGQFGAACATCHNTRSFFSRDEMKRQHQVTRFPLSGAHTSVECADCHRPVGASVLSLPPVDCVACHMNEYQATTNPDHTAGGYPMQCESCHNVTDWNSARLDHNATDFPLTGSHQAVACQSCHGDGVYDGKDTACVSCHQSDYDTTSNPNHQQAGYGTNCTQCHSATTWTAATFDHNATQFPLTGSHQAVACQSCHADGVYAGKDTACVSCHQSDYDATTEPHHLQAGFGTTCDSCHGTAAWPGAPYDHNQTQFPLTGAHQPLPCQSCHADAVYNGKNVACVACHQSDYDATTTPNHLQAGYSTDCTSCHATITWIGAQFDHNQTQFPLTGAHLAIGCQSCHADGVYAGKNTACVSCHQSDYDTTTAPNHLQAGYPTDCAGCHATTTWLGAQFNHSQTQFPLTGAHIGAACQSCHADGIYDGKNTACVSCHQSDYDTAIDPNHVSAGFDTDCTSCHDTVTWLNARMQSHDSSYFPIYSGAHRGRWSVCSDCHTNPTNYIDFICLQCHQHSDETKVTNDHQGESGFSYDSQACYSCHPQGRH